MSTDTEAAPSTPAPETNGTAPEPVTEPTTEAPETAATGEPSSEPPEPKATPNEQAPSVEAPTEMDDFETAINQTVVGFREGDIVEGRVVSVDADGAMVDVGYKSEGLIPTEELSIRANIDPSTIVSVGDKVEALVLNKEDDEGRLILSK
ncbi:MAG: S1 RNA-binding domain-containing protein, partial [bacterium]